MKLGFIKSVLATAIMSASASLWATTAVQPVQTALSAEQVQKKSGIEKQYFDSSISEKDDFYDHVNGLWLKNTAIPADKSRWGTFDILHEASVDQLHDIVDELSKQKSAEGSAEQKVANLYANFMDEKNIEALGIKPIQTEISNVDALKNKQQLAQLAAHFSRIGV
ncbi:MAG: M13 family metallopeptidase N-terminal domain-containing protein, partial [Acinetobacter sp.]